MHDSSSSNDDVKAKMREALDRKNKREQGVHTDAPGKQKVRGPEVGGGAAPQTHRRKAGGGGS